MRRRGNAILYINEDKISRSEIKTNNTKDHWELSAETTKVLEDSLIVFPRIFVTSEHEEDKHKYSLLVKAALSFDGHAVDGQIWRTIYGTHFYKTNPGRPASGETSSEAERDLARKMRHSVEEQRKAYNKLDAASSASTASTQKEKEKECTQEFEYSQTAAAERVRKYYNKHKEAERERVRLKYRENRIRYTKNRLINELNAGSRRSHERTMKTYGIKCINGIYV
jgi:hypothetical protein